MSDVVSQTINALPIGQLIYQAASGIAQAQYEMDLSSLNASQMMAGQLPDGEGGLIDTKVPMALGFDDGRRRLLHYSLYELGFVPTFYQFLDNELTVKIGMRMRKDELGASHVEAVPVDATYINRYNFNVLGASAIKVRMSPVPPPPKAADIEVLKTLGVNVETGGLAELTEVPFCLQAKTEALKGIGATWQRKLARLGIETLSQLAKGDSQGIAQLTVTERQTLDSLAKRAKAICYPAITLPVAQVSKMKMTELIHHPKQVLPLLPRQIQRQALENYLAMVDLSIDKAVLEDVQAKNFFDL